MKIAIMGCGAMGSVYAGLLAKAGNQVFAIDNNADHVAAMASQGLRVEGYSGDHTTALRSSTLPPDEYFDMIVVAVKAAHVEIAGERLHPMIGPDTRIITIQNGIGSGETLANYVPPDRLIIGIAGGFGAIRRGPGHVFHNAMKLIQFGAFAGLEYAKVEEVAQVWRSAGFAVEVSLDIAAMQWRKLICNSAYSGPCAVTGLTVGEALRDPDIGPVSIAAAKETWAVAKALGIAIQVDDPEQLARDFALGMPKAKPSTLQDIEKGRHSEIDVINGGVVRAAKKIGMHAPVNATLTAMVKHRERQF